MKPGNSFPLSSNIISSLPYTNQYFAVKYSRWYQYLRNATITFLPVCKTGRLCFFPFFFFHFIERNTTASVTNACPGISRHMYSVLIAMPRTLHRQIDTSPNIIPICRRSSSMLIKFNNWITHYCAKYWIPIDRSALWRNDMSIRLISTGEMEEDWRLPSQRDTRKFDCRAKPLVSLFFLFLSFSFFFFFSFEAKPRSGN